MTFHAAAVKVVDNLKARTQQAPTSAPSLAQWLQDDAVQELIRTYHAGVTAPGGKDTDRYKMACNCLMHSIYAPPLLYWAGTI
jgi:cystathionine beta-lyase/cystathionine gamma-synthase